jgi:hypothetical protein
MKLRKAQLVVLGRTVWIEFDDKDSDALVDSEMKSADRFFNDCLKQNLFFYGRGAKPPPSLNFPVP